MAKSRKIAPCLWFDNEAEQAARFYVSVFPNSKIKHIEKYSVDTPSNKPLGSVMTVTFELDGNEFMALNGGPFFKFNEAVSLIVPCENQKEIDYYYKKLSADPKAEICGWLRDKFGLSWQLIPKGFDKMMKSTNSEKKKRLMKALLEMKRIDMDKLERVAKEKK
jgi:predicted 3-demethylubiquinone-9 3-methyltransferase (glyoxalase superfamily)